MPTHEPTVFNGRYELLNHIARGGMADVYLARDSLLDRRVALKVLFPQFADDASFVERFRREAQAAANLSHPNIVGVYDWGQERGTYYIVMEYVEGRSMADVLRSTGPLRPDRAAEIAADVAGALSAAHSAGLVHRDIKLGNIILSDDGAVKVADFGIATAPSGRLGENLTQVGSVMGTATYFSPEQAQGKVLDGRSDLYSLGVVLYEMVTGSPPFTGENYPAVAYMHVKEQPVPPRRKAAGIAESLEAIILKLLAKNPANRYPSASDLRSDLLRYRAGAHRLTGRPASAATPAKPSVRPAAPTAAPQAPRRVPPAARVPRTGPRGPATGRSPATSRRMTRSTGVQPAVAVPDGQGGVVMQPGYYYEELPRHDSWKRTALMLVGLAGLLVALGYLVVIFYRSLDVGAEDPAPVADTTALIDVPSVTDLSLQEAEILLREKGLEIEVAYRVNPSIDENLVFAQTPRPGQRVESGEKVTVTVSQGETPTVPPIRGRSREEATQLLQAAGYVVIPIIETNPATAGTVIAQDPATGTELAPGEAVTITVSAGPGQIFVPDVRGLTQIEAFNRLTEAGFRVGEQRETSDTIETGQVIETDPAIGTPLERNHVVMVIISEGKPTVAVPDVSGLLVDSGRLTLEREGLVIGSVTFRLVEADSLDVGRILGQTPPANLEVEQGTVIDLVVGEAVEQPVPPDPSDGDESTDGSSEESTGESNGAGQSQ